MFLGPSSLSKHNGEFCKIFFSKIYKSTFMEDFKQIGKCIFLIILLELLPHSFWLVFIYFLFGDTSSLHDFQPLLRCRLKDVELQANETLDAAN